MPIIKQILSLAKTVSDLPPVKRKTACCQMFGAHKHGFFLRYPSGIAHCPNIPMVQIPRFRCLFCKKTFCVLPFCFLRRIAIPLPDILTLTNSSHSWEALIEDMNISRNTLWRWRKTGKTILKFLPELFALPDLTWRILSLHLSLLQYPHF